MEKPRATWSLSLPLEERRGWEGKKGLRKGRPMHKLGQPPRGSAHHSHTHSWAHPTQ